MMKFYQLLKCYCIMLVLISGGHAMAQQATVTGRVTSSDDGAPLPGVNILEKGTNNGTITDASGNFSISAAHDGVLVFSFVGYTSQEVSVSGRSAIDVILQADVTALSEVVVIGYGEVQKKDLTGSVVAVNTESFNKGIISSPQDLLIGKVPGVSITTNSGAPGSGATIRIRGGSSLVASNDPLIVIDGFPVDNSRIFGSPNPLATINPNDIETFTVLKDASATAIYGSRASNGVIIITTKKGKQDKFQLNYNGVVSISKARNYIDVFTGDEIRALAAELEAEGFSGLDDTALNRLGGANTDWQDEIYRAAFSHDHNINVSGSLKELPYRVSYGYTNQQGILRTTEMVRNSLNVNLNPSLLDDHLKINANLKTSLSQHNFSNEGAVGAAVAFDPTQPVRNGNSRYGGYFTWTNLDQALANGSNNPEGDRNPIGVANPVALIEQTDNRSDVTRTIANIQADYRFPFMPELRLNLNAGFDRAKGEGFNDIDADAGFLSAPQNRLTDYSSLNTSELFEAYFNYQKDFSFGKIDATAGYSWQHFKREQESITQNAEGTLIASQSSYKNENFLVSFFGRLNYTVKDRYLFTLSLRNDGSSRVVKENRWGLFPAAAFGWNISNESFMANSNVVSNLKLRLSYGITGQQDTGDNYYPYLATYRESVNGASYQFGSAFVNTLRPDAYDINFKWEETTTYNAGLDFGFIDDRLTGSFDIYQRTTDDLINFIPIAAGSNFSNFLLTNVGSLENNGFEVALNGSIIDKGDLSWSLGVNMGYNENKITKLTITDDPNYSGVAAGGISGGVGNMIQNHQVGYPAYSFFVFQQIYDSDGNPIEGFYADRSGNGGSVTANELNKYRFKKPAADVLIGINTNLRYKNFDLFAAGRISLGNYVYNNVFSDRAVYQALYNQSGFFNNLPTAINDTRFAQPQYFSDYYVEDGSFFRMDNISLGYNFSKVVTEKVKARISFTVQNAFVITDYSGLDPEVNNGTEPGVDKNIYPRPRVFMLGFSLTY